MAKNAKAGQTAARNSKMLTGRNQVEERQGKPTGTINEPGDVLASTGRDARTVGDPGLNTKGMNVRAAPNTKPGGTPGMKGGASETGRPGGKVKY